MVPGREGVKEMSTDNIGRKSPNLHMSRPRVTRDRPDGPVPAGRWARRPLTGRNGCEQVYVTSVKTLFTVISHK